MNRLFAAALANDVLVDAASLRSRPDAQPDDAAFDERRRRRKQRSTDQPAADDDRLVQRHDVRTKW